MKNYTTFKVLFFFLFLFYSCDKEAHIYNVTLKKTETLELPIEGYVNPVKSSVVYYENYQKNKTIAFFILKESDQEIQIFDIQTKTLIKKIPIKRSGPDKFISVSGIQLLNNHKILFNTGRGTSFLISDYGLQNLESHNYNVKYKDLVKYSNSRIKPVFTAQIYKQDYIVYNDSLVFITQAHDLFDFEDIKDFSIGLIYNSKTNETSLLDLHYPDENYINDKLVTYVGQTFNGKEIIYSFAASNQILKYHPITNKKEYIELPKSDYMKNFTSLKNTDDSFKKFSYAFANNSHNLSFVYDSYKNVYYRFFYPGIDINIDDNKLIYYSENFKFFTITVFDDNFNKVCELLLPENTYDPASFFIASDGLYLGYSEENINYSDDYLKFDKFNLVKQ